jgi:hypothetical protein
MGVCVCDSKAKKFKFFKFPSKNDEFLNSQKRDKPGGGGGGGAPPPPFFLGGRDLLIFLKKNPPPLHRAAPLTKKNSGGQGCETLPPTVFCEGDLSIQRDAAHRFHERETHYRKASSKTIIIIISPSRPWGATPRTGL